MFGYLARTIWSDRRGRWSPADRELQLTLDVIRGSSMWRHL